MGGVRGQQGPGRDPVPGAKQMGFLHEHDTEPPECLFKEVPESGQSFQKMFWGCVDRMAQKHR